MRYFCDCFLRFSRFFILAVLAFLTFGCSAIEHLETPDHVAANIYEGDRQLTLSHPVAARKWFDRAVAIAPNRLETYTGTDDNPAEGLIPTLTTHNDWPDLVQYVSKATEQPALSDDWQLWYALANAYSELGKTSLAQASSLKQLDLLEGSQLKKGASIAAMLPDRFLLIKAEAEWSAGHRKDSVKDYQRIIERYPQDATGAQNDLAYSYADAGVNLPQAYALATTAVDAARQNGAKDEIVGMYLDTLGWAQYKLGNNRAAAVSMEEAISDMPREAISHYHLAKIYQSLGSTEEAQIEIQRAVLLDPSNATIQDAAQVIGTTNSSEAA